MHEFSITQNLLDIALKESDSRQIVRVHLSIGPFSEEREDSIRFYWKDLAKGSPAEGAELQFERLPIELKCLNCTGTFYLDGELSMCQFCHVGRLQILSGEEVKLERVEVK